MRYGVWFAAVAQLSIVIRKGVGLAAFDNGGTSNPYVNIRVGKQPCLRTSTKASTLHPVWEESFSMFAEAMDEAIVLEVHKNCPLPCTRAHAHMHAHADVLTHGGVGRG